MRSGKLLTKSIANIDKIVVGGSGKSLLKQMASCTQRHVIVTDEEIAHHKIKFSGLLDKFVVVESCS